MKTLMLIFVMGTLMGSPKRWSSTPEATPPRDSWVRIKATPQAKTKAKRQTVQTLVPLTAVRALPKPGKAVAIPGYRGSQFRVGLVRSAKKWKAFVAKGGKAFTGLHVDWKRQMVVYAVFTGQTNSLSFKRWVGPKNGTAQLHIHWSGIEPYYSAATPGVFHVVNRAGVHRITVKTVSGYAAGRNLTIRVR